MTEKQRGGYNGEPIDHQDEKATKDAAQPDAGRPGSAGTDESEEPEIILQNLAEELEQERMRSSEYLDQAQRARAELINYRRRMEQETQNARKFAAEHLISRILPVIDDFQRANEAIPPEERDDPWVQGMRLIERKMWSILEYEGVKPIESVGKPFDPSIHEAVSVDADGGDTVVEEFQRGYMLHDRAIRPAMVKVGRARTEQQDNNA
jgi:molecular chaperone GrpE